MLFRSNGLPTEITSQVLSVDMEEGFYRYVITKNGEEFAGALSGNGATITSIAPLNLREIFLHLVRKEQPCTSGNAGAKPVFSQSYS